MGDAIQAVFDDNQQTRSDRTTQPLTKPADNLGKSRLVVVFMVNLLLNVSTLDKSVEPRVPWYRY